jgi:hypothetical protein
LRGDDQFNDFRAWRTSREAPTQILGVPNAGLVAAEDHGIFEPFVDLAHMVSPGAAIGKPHFDPSAGIATRSSTTSGMGPGS